MKRHKLYFARPIGDLAGQDHSLVALIALMRTNAEAVPNGSPSRSMNPRSLTRVPCAQDDCWDREY